MKYLRKGKSCSFLKILKLKPCPLPGPAHIHPVQLIVRRHTFNLEWKKKSYQDVSLESSYKENFPPPLCEVLHFLLVQTSSCLAAASPGSAAAARQVSAAVLDPALAVEEEASAPVVAEQEVFAVAEQEVFAVAAVLGKVLFPGSAAAAAGQLLGRWADLLEIPGVALDPVELEVAGPPVHHRVQELTFEVLEV